MDQKDQEDANKCSECMWLFFDVYNRCALFDNAIIQDVEVKNCES